MADYTVFTSQSFSEAEKVLDLLTDSGLEARMDTVEMQSAYSNAVQWFQVNVSQEDRKRADELVHGPTPDPVEQLAPAAARGRSNPKKAWGMMALGGLLMGTGLSLFTFSTEVLGEYALFLSGMIFGGGGLLLAGLLLLRRSS